MERSRNLFDVDEGDVPFPTFDPSHIRAVQAAQVGKPLLGEAKLLAPLSNCPAEPAANILHSWVLCCSACTLYVYSL